LSRINKKSSNKHTVRIEDNGLGFYFILFYFPLFSLIFLLKSRKQKRQSVTWSQKSRAHMTQENNIEDSGKDEVITTYRMHVGLKANI